MKQNIRIYWDADTDPSNPGYVLAWSEGEQDNRTVALDATEEAEAIQEASNHLGLLPDEITVEE